MSSIHTLAFFLLWFSVATPDKTPDVTVKCIVSEECMLPCSFQPGSEETIKWFRQDVVVYKFKRNDDDNDDDDNDGDDSDDDDDDDSINKEHKQFAGRVSIFPHLISRGNATMILRSSGLKDRGTYRCHVSTSNGKHDAKVILKVEAPIQGLSLELSRLSGNEEVKCTVHNVFPTPRITWATEPPTFENLRPITRMRIDQQGLYEVDSRLRLLKGQPDLIYICKATTSYGGPAWTTSLREREIQGSQGRDLTIPCYAPPYLNNPTLNWNFSKDEVPSHIVTYDSRSGHSITTPSWNHHVELDGFRVPFGDGSLRLMDPTNSKHTGSFICVFSMPYNTHTERTAVTIDEPLGQARVSDKPSYWWVAVLVTAVLIVALVGTLVYLRMKGNIGRKHKNDPERMTELRSVKDATADSNPSESSHLNVSGPQSGT